VKQGEAHPDRRAANVDSLKVRNKLGLTVVVSQVTPSPSGQFVYLSLDLISMPLHCNIHRVDREALRAHALVVIVQNKGEICIRMFSDGVYGGKEEALAAAIAYRDLLLSGHSPSEQSLWVRTRLRRNNTSGLPGVGRYERRANPNTGHRAIYWNAAWLDEYGRNRMRKFSVFRYGEEQAKQLAIAERERQLLRICALKDTP